MTEEQRKQAASQRCAELVNKSFESGSGYTAAAFMQPGQFPVQGALLNAILELDELARGYKNNHSGFWAGGYPYERHILPEPKPSPVERLADSYGVAQNDVEDRLKHLGLKLVEVDPSDDR